MMARSSPVILMEGIVQISYSSICMSTITEVVRSCGAANRLPTLTTWFFNTFSWTGMWKIISALAAASAFSDSVIGRTDGASDHTDLFQITGNYFKIYNNDIRESENSIFRIQNLAGAPTYTNVMHDVWFFNNIYSEKEGRGAGGTWDEPGCIVNFDPLHPAGLQVYSNIIIANNLWYNTVTNRIFMPGATPDGLPINSTIYWSKGGATVVTNAYITNCLFVNNLFIDRQKGVKHGCEHQIDRSGRILALQKRCSRTAV